MERVKIVENQLVISEELVEQLKELQYQKKIIEYKESKIKEEIMNVMQDSVKPKWESPDGSLKLAYVEATESMIFDSERFKKDHLDLYYEYQKPSKRKASLRITVTDKDEGTF